MIKICALVAAMLLVASDIGANLAMPVVAGYRVPYLISLGMLAAAGVLSILAYVAHVFGRLDAKIDLLMEVLVGRMEDLERRMEDRDGEPDAAALGQGPDTAVRPLTTANLPGSPGPADRA